MASSADSTSLYRRHRPGSFDEVVGQQHVVRTLRNAVEQSKVHHAYLFVGSRGTGKTSMAKILARSLNCERGGPTVTPCGECESCVTIASGTSVDVIEMDAASNRSVDDIRDLRERVAYAPTGGRWKVYILDEAHMLTKEAWNAFLKTLEEPPPNTVFVLATTESHKVMATIADRCQRFDFQRPSLEQISEVLNRVAVAEEIQIDEGAVAMLARAASGSFRDALGTLDQLVAFGGGGASGVDAGSAQVEIKLNDVLELLGVADAELLFEVLDGVARQDPKAVLLGVDKMARSGRDPAQFTRDLLAHMRHLLVAKTIGEVPSSFVITASDAGRLEAQAAAIGDVTLVRTIDELAAALTAVREGDDARMAVEIALLKASRPDLDPSSGGLLRRIERLERGVAGGVFGVTPPPSPAPASPEAAPPPPPSPPPPSPPAPAEPAPTPVADTPSPEPTPADSADDAGEDSAEPAPAESVPAPSSADEAPATESDAPDEPAEEDTPDVPQSAAVEPPAEEPPAEGEPSSEPAESSTEPADPSAEPPESSTEPADTPAPDAGDEEPTPADAAEAEDSLDLEQITRVWPAVLDHLRQTAPALAATFEDARPVALDAEERTLTVGFPAESTFNKRKAEAPDKREQVAEALATVTGEDLRLVYVLLDGKDVPASAGGGETVDDDALVEKLKSEFNAEEVS